MYQPELETMPKADKRRLQSDRLVSLVDRLKASEVPYWQNKMASRSRNSVTGWRRMETP